MIGDFLHASRRAVFVTFERVMPLSEIREARDDQPNRPPWPVLFAKAIGLVAERCPEVRHAYLRWPRPQIYEHHETVGSVVVAKRHAGEDFLLILPMRSPGRSTVKELASIVRRAKESPVSETRAFRRHLRVGRYPFLLRRPLWGLMEWSGSLRARQLGTFGISATAGAGAAALQLVTPWSAAFCYDVFRPDGTLPVRLTFDHRVFDGAAACRILVEMEAALNGPVLRELAMSPVTTSG
jgi:hypothetical protein